MSALRQSHKLYLQKTFGDRISFDEIERKIYSHDVGELPRLIKPVMGNTLADAVVQPASETELAALVKWARENAVPLTPRGKATSGYGGVFPVKQGLIVDFYRMNRLLAVDKENDTATVEAGMVWEALDGSPCGSTPAATPPPLSADGSPRAARG